MTQTQIIARCLCKEDGADPTRHWGAYAARAADIINALNSGGYIIAPASMFSVERAPNADASGG